MVLTDALEKKYIDNIITTQIFASVYLKNGIRLKGHLIGHDGECVFLKADETQIIYKTKISTICPEISLSSCSA
jgi:RNA chaperone Hfq